MQNYRGMAVGGPHDGKLIDHETPVYYVPVVEFPAPGQMPQPGALIESKVFTYHHRRITEHLSLWTERDMSTDEALCKLAASYRPAVGAGRR